MGKEKEVSKDKNSVYDTIASEKKQTNKPGALDNRVVDEEQSPKGVEPLRVEPLLLYLPGPLLLGTHQQHTPHRVLSSQQLLASHLFICFLLLSRLWCCLIQVITGLDPHLC